MEGYYYFFDPEVLLTVWSAPNYCYRNGNKATTCTFKQDRKILKRFSEVDHDKVVPVDNLIPYFL